ncbi:MAG: caspase family protein [Treponema sp.]
MKSKNTAFIAVFVFFSCMLAVAQTRRIEAKKKGQEGLGGIGSSMSNPELVFNTGLTEPANDIYYTPNGKYLVSSCSDGVIKLWEVETGRELKTLTEYTRRVTFHAYSHDKKYLAIIYSDGEIQIWEVEIGRCIQTLHEEILDGTSYEESKFVFSHDGKYLAVTYTQSMQDGDYKVYWNNKIKLWDIINGSWAKTLTWTSDCYIGLIAYSFDGEYLVNITNDAIEICKMKTGEFVKIVTDESYSLKVDSVSISPDSKYLACSYSDGINHVNGRVEIFETETLTLIKTLTGHTEGISLVSYSPDGKYLATGSIDSTLKLWDLVSGKCLTTISDIIVDKMGKTEMSIVFSPDGNVLATLHKDNTIKLWKVATGRLIKTLTVKKLDEYDVPYYNTSITYSPDGRCLAVADWGKNIKLLEVETGKELKTLRRYTDFARIDYSPDGAYMATIMGDGCIKLLEMASGKFKILNGYIGYILNTFFSSDGKYFISVYGKHYRENTPNDNTIKIWDVKTGKCLQIITGHIEEIVLVRYSPDEKYIAGASTGGTIRLWDVASGRCVKTLIGHTGSISHIVYSPNGKYLASDSGDGTIKLWDVSTGRCVKTLTGHTGSISHIVYSPNGKYLASTDRDEKIKLWEVQTGNCLKTLDGYKEYDLNSLVYSADGKYLVSTGDRILAKIWEVETGNCIKTFEKDNKNLWGDYGYLEVSPDGLYLAGTVDGETIKLWKIRDGKCIEKTLIAHINSIHSIIAFSPDGMYLTCASGDGIIKICDIKTGKCIKELVDNSMFVSKMEYSPKGKYLALASLDHNTISLWEVDTGKFINNLHVNLYDTQIIYSPDDKYLTTISNQSILKFWNVGTGELLATTLNLKDGEWLTYTPEGFFVGSEWATKNLVHIVDGMRTVGIDQMYDHLYRPDLVSSKLNGEDISAYAKKVNFENLVRSGSAPITAFLNLDEEIANRDVAIEYSIQNTGGGIGEVNLILNGKNIRLAETVPSTSGQTLYFSHTVTLQNGKNILELYAKNKAGKVESLRVSKMLNWNGNVRKPNLYVLTVAVNKYRDRELQLKYAVPDAEAIIKGFESQKKSLYQNILTFNLFDGNVTKEGLKTSFQELSKKVEADDVFVFYIAGHGMTYEDGDYYYLPSDFRYTGSESIAKGGISKNDLTRFLSLIKAGKTLVLLDTCNSGSFLDSSARGLTEKTAIDRLTRSTGHATIAASTDRQSAMEGYEGHGIFTYILVEGLSGKADKDGDGFITLQELSAYAEEEVPRRSYEKWGYEQTPMRDLRKQDFPIYMR